MRLHVWEKRGYVTNQCLGTAQEAKTRKQGREAATETFQGTAPGAAFASHEVRRLTWTPGERLIQAFWSRCIMASTHTSMACGRALLCPACRRKHIADQSHSPALLLCCARPSYRNRSPFLPLYWARARLGGRADPPDPPVLLSNLKTAHPGMRDLVSPDALLRTPNRTCSHVYFRQGRI